MLRNKKNLLTISILLFSTLLSDKGIAEVNCNSPDIINAVKNWQNNELAKKNTTVQSISFAGQNNGVCFYDFAYSDGTVDPMLGLKSIGNGQFQIAIQGGSGDGPSGIPQNMQQTNNQRICINAVPDNRFCEVNSIQFAGTDGNGKPNWNVYYRSYVALRDPSQKVNGELQIIKILPQSVTVTKISPSTGGVTCGEGWLKFYYNPC